MLTMRQILMTRRKKNSKSYVKEKSRGKVLNKNVIKIISASRFSGRRRRRL